MKRVAMLIFIAFSSTQWASCSGNAAHPDPEHGLGIGFETIIEAPESLNQLASDINSTDINALYISVGRIDWTGYPWTNHENAWSGPVSENGADYVERTIKTLATTETERHRRIILVVDCLAPKFLEAHPDLQGLDEAGTPADGFPSVAALEDSTYRTELLDLAADVAQRFSPEEIAFTELMFDDHTFGPKDLTSYKKFTGHSGWPLLPNGRIDQTDSSIAQWRSHALAGFLQAARERIHPFNIDVSIDVRTDLQDPLHGRAASGHDVPLLAMQADRITVWNYFGLSGYPPEHSERIVEKLENARLPSEFVYSVGLWNTPSADSPGPTITAHELETALRSSAISPSINLQVTPVSLMTDEHWKILQRLWAPIA